MDKSVCVFGDSTAWGAWDTEKGGWVNRLWLSLAHGSEANDYFELYNLSISGGTTETILERFEKEALNRSQELESANPKDHYLITLISKTNRSLRSNSVQKADELLMYSILFKNLIQVQHPLY